MTRKATAAELKAFQDAACKAYETAADHEGSLRPTRTVQYTFHTYYHAIQCVADKAAEGYTVNAEIMINLFSNGSSYTVALRKPESMVAADLEIVRQRAEVDYKASIARYNQQEAEAKARQERYEAQKAAWLKERAEAQAKEEDEAFRQAMSLQGVELPRRDQVEGPTSLTSEWSN